MWVQEAGHHHLCRQYPRYYFELQTHRKQMFERWAFRDLTDRMKPIVKSYGKVEIYYCYWMDEVTYAPWYLGWLRPILLWRDWLARDWCQFVRDHKLVGNQERIPWPKWLECGW